MAVLNSPEQIHSPVLLKACLSHLSWSSPETRVADLTLGMGGHLEALLKDNPEPAYVLAGDQDLEALAIAKKRLEKFSKIDFRHQNFESMKDWETEGFDRVIVDLGVSSLQLDEAKRGFSFRQDGPLDMRMNQSEGSTALDWLMECTEREFVQVMRDYGEERRAPVYARRWVHERKTRTVQTTRDFVEALGHRLDSKTPRGIHPLTRVFQAIRIKINREMEVLEAFLENAPYLLKKNGRLAVISFHSLEDRLVKWRLRDRLKAVNKKVIQATEEEKSQNPRARTAKLRVFQKSDE